MVACDRLAAISELDQHIQRHHDALRQRRQAFRETQREVAALRRAAGSQCALDVGGTRFHTTTATLQTHGDRHLLAAMVSGAFAPEADAENVLFVDRDPAHFATILRYLRDGNVCGLPNQRTPLWREWRYYGLPDHTERYLLCLGELPRGDGRLDMHLFGLDRGVWDMPRPA
jgi:hypothetical protein